MTDTTLEGTSDGKLCGECGAPFGEDDDKRYGRCAKCRGAAPKPATAASRDEDGVQPVTLDVEQAKPPPIEDRDFYWCGTTKDCPMDITLGGFEFPKTIGRVREREDGNYMLETEHQDGAIHPLTDANVALIKEHCANKVIRGFRVEELQLLNGGTRTRYRGTLRGISGSKRRVFTPQADDRPLGQFVYMVKVRHANDRPMSDPPTMVPRDW